VPGKIQEWIDKQGFLAQRLEDLFIAIGIGIALFAVWNGLVFIAGVASSAAALGVSAITGALGLMLSPIGLIIIGLTAAIALYHELQTFQKTVNTAAQGAQGATTKAISSGLTKQQYMDKAFASSVAELGDAGARLFWANGGQALFERTYANAAAGVGHALGIKSVPEDGIYKLHAGEEVRTAAEAQWGSGSSGQPITVNFYGGGAPANEAEANDAAFMLVNGLRTQGLNV